jgi:L-fuconolactonase
MTIDTHHHFWRYTPEEFGWIGDDMAAIRRNFLPDDLARELSAAGVDAAVAVQARQTEDETRWLLSIAAERPSLIAGVVGWVPLAANDVGRRLDSYAADPKLIGVRHVVQGEPDGFLARADFNRGIATLPRFDLAYDLLVVARQLPEAIAFVDRHPDVRFVVDHLAKPDNDRGTLEPWRTHLTDLARRPNVWCKLSGGITEADLDWTPGRLRPYFDAALDAFGPRRLMFGSNWPVCAAAGGYAKWIGAIRAWAQPLSDDERGRLFRGTAIDAYRLRVDSV